MMFLLSLIFLFVRINGKFNLLLLSFAIALLFYKREYGVMLGVNGTDDVIAYMRIYEESLTLSLSDIFVRFVKVPSPHEPLWNLIPWILGHVFFVSTKSFVFIYYFLSILLLFWAIKSYAKDDYLIIVLLMFLFTPDSIYSIFHTWRQQMAFIVYLMGLISIRNGNTVNGFLLIFLTPFFHLSAMYFVFVGVSAFIFLDKTAEVKYDKFRTLLYAIVFSIFIFLFSRIFYGLLEFSGIDKMNSILSTDSVMNTSAAVTSLYKYALFLILIPFLFVIGKWETFLSLIIMSSILYAFIFPTQYGIYQRLQVFAFPLFSFYIYALMGFVKSKWYLSIVIIMCFVSGMYRVSVIKDGVVSWMGYGSFFDPFMGIIRLLMLG